MTGCPSREQLASLLAEQTVGFDGSELGAHLRTCPECRELLEAWSPAGAAV